MTTRFDRVRREKDKMTKLHTFSMAGGTIALAALVTMPAFAQETAAAAEAAAEARHATHPRESARPVRILSWACIFLLRLRAFFRLRPLLGLRLGAFLVQLGFGILDGGLYPFDLGLQLPNRLFIRRIRVAARSLSLGQSAGRDERRDRQECHPTHVLLHMGKVGKGKTFRLSYGWKRRVGRMVTKMRHLSRMPGMAVLRRNVIRYPRHSKVSETSA